ncbi:C-type lectin mannose-binding isoform [Biomphalaria glabrata]|nr:C-type lectin mannose-binding isoform [Biomphalaria glabrata]
MSSVRIFAMVTLVMQAYSDSEVFLQVEYSNISLWTSTAPVNVLDKSDCALKCLQQDDCYAFGYKTTTASCTLGFCVVRSGKASVSTMKLYQSYEICSLIPGFTIQSYGRTSVCMWRSQLGSRNYTQARDQCLGK